MTTNIERCRRTLTCVLTDLEKKLYAEDLARTTTELSTLEDRKKEIGSEFKGKIDKAVADTRLFANRISTGREMREVECIWEFDYSEGIKHLRRTDTSEIIENKVLSIDERQQRLDFDKQEEEEAVKAAEESFSGDELPMTPGEEKEAQEYLEDCEAMTHSQEDEAPFVCQDCKKKKKKLACGAENCNQ